MHRRYQNMLYFLKLVLKYRWTQNIQDFCVKFSINPCHPAYKTFQPESTSVRQQTFIDPTSERRRPAAVTTRALLGCPAESFAPASRQCMEIAQQTSTAHSTKVRFPRAWRYAKLTPMSTCLLQTVELHYALYRSQVWVFFCCCWSTWVSHVPVFPR